MALVARTSHVRTLSHRMKMVEGLWCGLPFEIVDRVLSFVPIQALCKFRVVCKRWNTLIGTSLFHAMCGKNPEEKLYVLIARNRFLTRSVKSQGWRLLDLKMREWYTIRDEFLGDLENMEGFCERRTLAVEGGLICMLYTESLNEESPAHVLVVCNPVAKTMKKLPALKLHPCFDFYYEPVVIMTVDHTSRSYKIIVVNNLPWEDHSWPRMHVYESCTDQWRNLRDPPYELKPEASSSSIMFQGLLYNIFTTVLDNSHWLLTYNLNENVWSKVGVCIPKETRVPQLVVSDGRLFMVAGWEETLQLPTVRNPTPEQPFPSNRLEIWEIMANEKVCLRLVKMPGALLEGLWSENSFYWSSYWNDLDRSVGCNSHIFAVGLDKSILLVSSSGILMNYDLVRSTWDPWPPAWGYGSDENNEEGEGLYAKVMSLSLNPML